MQEEIWHWDGSADSRLLFPNGQAVCPLAGIGIHVARLRGCVPALLVLMDDDTVWAVGVRFPWHESFLPIEFYWIQARLSKR